jgi:hypothetical protein
MQPQNTAQQKTQLELLNLQERANRIEQGILQERSERDKMAAEEARKPKIEPKEKREYTPRKPKEPTAQEIYQDVLDGNIEKYLPEEWRSKRF